MDCVINDKNVDFSVIIPHYNSVSCLDKLLDTIPVNEKIQLIVVDDKSDEDVRLVESKVLSRGGVFVHNTTDRKGAGTCRNLGLQEAVGKWLVFADADDFFLDHAFEIMYRYAESDADIIYFVPTSVYRGTDKIAGRHRELAKMINDFHENPCHENELRLRYGYKSPCSKLVKRNLAFENNITFDEVPAANDAMFSIRCAYHAGRIEVCKDTIYCITYAEGTLETAHNEKNLWARAEIFNDMYRFLQERLPMEDFACLELNGLPLVLLAVKRKYSLPFIIKMYMYMRRNEIIVFSFKAIVQAARMYRIRRNSER